MLSMRDAFLLSFELGKPTLCQLQSPKRDNKEGPSTLISRMAISQKALRKARSSQSLSRWKKRARYSVSAPRATDPTKPLQGSPRYAPDYPQNTDQVMVP